MAKSISQRSQLIFPVCQIERILKQDHKRRNGIRTKRVTTCAAVFLATVLEYVMAEVLELAGNECLNDKRKSIQDRHIFRALNDDDEIRALIYNTEQTTTPCMTIDDLINIKPKKEHKANNSVDVEFFMYDQSNVKLVKSMKLKSINTPLQRKSICQNMLQLDPMFITKVPRKPYEFDPIHQNEINPFYLYPFRANNAAQKRTNHLIYIFSIDLFWESDQLKQIWTFFDRFQEAISRCVDVPDAAYSMLEVEYPRFCELLTILIQNPYVQRFIFKHKRLWKPLLSFHLKLMRCARGYKNQWQKMRVIDAVYWKRR
eukprot:397603_1